MLEAAELVDRVRAIAHAIEPDTHVKARISGLGMWLPETVRTNDAWSAEFLESARARGDRLLVDIPAAGHDLARQVGIEALAGAPLAHFARELEVVAWRNRPVTGPSAC